MNRKVLVFGILLLAVAVVIAVVGLGGRGREVKDGAPNHGATRPSSRSERSSSARSATRAPAKPVDPVKRLRSLIADANPSAPGASFRDLEAMAATLNDDDLAELIASVGFDGASGAKGWVRCALYAEWGRRDPQAALAQLEGIPRGEEINEAIDQSWASLFGGWAQQDPIKAHEALAALQAGADGPGDLACQKATTAIFRELARQDSAQAWKMVQESAGGLTNLDTVAGFFAGLRAGGELQSFLADWNETQWDTDEARAAFDAYDRERMASLDSDIAVPPPSAERQALTIGRAWAQHDLDAALAWLNENGPGIQPHRTWRASQVARDWARHEPTEALAKLSEERYAAQRVFLGYGAILGDPSLATEVLKTLTDDNARISILTLAVGDSSAVYEADLMPAAGTASHPLDPATRYQHLLDAINTSGFDARRQSDLRMQLNLRNSELLPAAQEALGLDNQE